MKTLVTIGEQLGRITTWHEGPVRAGSVAGLSVCGAEATVAIGTRRLGIASRFVGRVGSDAFGRVGLSVLRAEGVDVAGVVVDPDAPTGLLIRSQRTTGRVVVEYLRRGSAGSRLAPDDLDPVAITTADLLHITGITPALSQSAAAAVEAAVSLARSSGVPISLDVNYRSTLWPVEAARPVLRRLAAAADVVIGGPAELALLGDDFAQIGALGPREVVRTEGSGGATAWVDGHSYTAAARPAQVVDVVGAGDAFVSGYLAAKLAEAPIDERLELGNIVGAFAVSTRGDWEGLPTLDEIGMFDHDDDVLR